MLWQLFSALGTYNALSYCECVEHEITPDKLELDQVEKGVAGGANLDEIKALGIDGAISELRPVV